MLFESDGQTDIGRYRAVSDTVWTAKKLTEHKTLNNHVTLRIWSLKSLATWVRKRYLAHCHNCVDALPGSLYPEVCGIYCPAPVLPCGKFVETKRQASFQLEDLPDDQARLNLFALFQLPQPLTHQQAARALPTQNEKKRHHPKRTSTPSPSNGVFWPRRFPHTF